MIRTAQRVLVAVGFVVSDGRTNTKGCMWSIRLSLTSSLLVLRKPGDEKILVSDSLVARVLMQ